MLYILLIMIISVKFNFAARQRTGTTVAAAVPGSLKSYCFTFYRGGAGGAPDSFSICEQISCCHLVSPVMDASKDRLRR